MKSLLIISALFLSACTTAMWNSDYYQESLNGFHVVSDKNVMIVSGEKYSYIFSINDEFKSLLTVSRSVEFNPIFQGFELHSDNSIDGNIHFHVKDALTESQKNAVEGLGFTQGTSGNYSLSVELTGKRYQVEGELPFVKLEDPHFVIIQEPSSFIGTLGKIIATPVTLTVDAIGVIGVATVFTWVGVSQSISD